MAAWLVVLVPLFIMFFALGMERVERRLRDLAVREEEVEEFLEQAQPEEVRALYGHGIGRALELFRGRRRGPRRTRPATRTAAGTSTNSANGEAGTRAADRNGTEAGAADGGEANGELRHPDRDVAGSS